MKSSNVEKPKYTNIMLTQHDRKHVTRFIDLSFLDNISFINPIINEEKGANIIIQNYHIWKSSVCSFYILFIYSCSLI